MYAQITARLQNHTHKTARSEMLYAILVEGGGVYGSAFDKDDFTSKEVQDTDGDGLMEFVDAWGEPLQFYRWPILLSLRRSEGVPGHGQANRQDMSLLRYAPGPYAATTTRAQRRVSYDSREQESARSQIRRWSLRPGGGRSTTISGPSRAYRASTRGTSAGPPPSS